MGAGFCSRLGRAVPRWPGTDPRSADYTPLAARGMADGRLLPSGKVDTGTAEFRLGVARGGSCTSPAALAGDAAEPVASSRFVASSTSVAGNPSRCFGRDRFRGGTGRRRADPAAAACDRRPDQFAHPRNHQWRLWVHGPPAGERSWHKTADQRRSRDRGRCWDRESAAAELRQLRIAATACGDRIDQPGHQRNHDRQPKSDCLRNLDHSDGQQP